MWSAAGRGAVTSIKEEETQKLLRVEEELHKRIISQEKAISALAAPFAFTRGLKSPNRPSAASVLGHRRGKTEMADAGQFLFGSTRLSSASICRSTWRSTRLQAHRFASGYVGYEEAAS